MGVPGVGGVETAVVGFRACHDVLDISVRGSWKVTSRVWPVDSANHDGDDLRLARLRIGIVLGVLKRVAVLGHDGEAAPGVDRRATFDPQYHATSIAYRADQRATHAPSNKRSQDQSADCHARVERAR